MFQTALEILVILLEKYYENVAYLMRKCHGSVSEGLQLKLVPQGLPSAAEVLHSLLQM